MAEHNSVMLELTQKGDALVQMENNCDTFNNMIQTVSIEYWVCCNGKCPARFN